MCLTTSPQSKMVQHTFPKEHTTDKQTGILDDLIVLYCNRVQVANVELSVSVDGYHSGGLHLHK